MNIRKMRICASFSSNFIKLYSNIYTSDVIKKSLTYTKIEKGTYIPELVGKALSALTPMHKKLLLMKYEQELSLSEIARNLGRSPDSVKSAIKRARAAFRRAFTATKKFYEKEQ